MTKIGIYNMLHSKVEGKYYLQTRTSSHSHLFKNQQAQINQGPFQINLIYM
ncbi:AAEL012121-PA [Aedes aegypti]|uniref:AAEL012121-PA n=1 Tax=Aedes aegypti TaxID=7159 RepID=Q16N20_AEDAE|nr:AAEL012121-PA [Aedes aegypti]